MARKNKTETKSSTIKKAGSAGHHEMVGVVFLLAASILLLALWSYKPNDPIFEGLHKPADNWIGLVGAYLADSLLLVFGISVFFVVAGLLYGAVFSLSRGVLRLPVKRGLAVFLFILLGTTVGHIIFRNNLILGHAPGGVVGEYLGGLFISLLSDTGALVVAGAGMLMCLMSITDLKISTIGIAVGRLLSKTCTWVVGSIRSVLVALANLLWRGVKHSSHKFGQETREFLATLKHNPASAKELVEAFDLEEAPLPLESVEIPARLGLSVNLLAPPVSQPPPLSAREPLVVTCDPDPLLENLEATPLPVRSFRDIKREHEPEIIMPRTQQKEDPPFSEEPVSRSPSVFKNYTLPELSFLDDKKEEQTVIEKEQLHQYARRLEEKLSDYGVEGHVTKIMPGPVVTMYEYAPAPGVKVSKIAGLSNDLALALEAMSVRIVAPIPGRAVVGIEVANKKRQTVYAKEIIGHASFQKRRSPLTLAFGKDIEGLPFVADLNKMPHLLVAGATGTGKSVALNIMITSILYRATPEDVRFIMIDPKVLELSLYEGIPHLLLPVVTDPRKAQAALHWAVNEMERRIGLLHAAGVRSLDSYNKKARQQSGLDDEDESEPNQEKKKKIIIIDKTADPVGFSAVEEESAPPPYEPTLEPLPHIVIVIDELADLMMTSSREVEASICRIAQKARAAGIHLLIATQRPSVNVITGLIKANLPARISFRVASKTDSRTILDQNGAETLLGNGDMLFHPPTSSQVIRIHGALITEDEITHLVEYLKAQAQPVYDETILASAEEETSADEDASDEYDELYDKAIEIVAQMGQASTSMIQRKLRIGYNRAARLIERMEREGIVGPADGARPREVLVQDTSLAP